MAAAVSRADDKKADGKFAPGPVSSYPARQTNDNVTVAAAAYDTEELAHSAFGKLDPNQYGILPVLVIIQNDTDQALRLDHLEAEYTGVDGRHVEATRLPMYRFWVVRNGRRASRVGFPYLR